MDPGRDTRFRDAIRIAILGGHDAIHIEILVYRVNLCLYLHIFFSEAWQCNIIHRHTSTGFLHLSVNQI